MMQGGGGSSRAVVVVSVVVGDQALIIIKGPMVCFLHHLEEHGSHLNEYQINTLESLQRTPDCHVRYARREVKHVVKKKRKRKRFFFHVCVDWTENKQPRGSFPSLKHANTKQVDTL